MKKNINVPNVLRQNQLLEKLKEVLQFVIFANLAVNIFLSRPVGLIEKQY